MQNGRYEPSNATMTLHVNWLNNPIKRQRLSDWLKKQDPTICWPRRDFVRRFLIGGEAAEISTPIATRPLPVPVQGVCCTRHPTCSAVCSNLLPHSDLRLCADITTYVCSHFNILQPSSYLPSLIHRISFAASKSFLEGNSHSLLGAQHKILSDPSKFEILLRCSPAQ